VAAPCCCRWALVLVQWVVMKMLPFDNKSEFQVVVDMPAGTPLEDTAATLQELGAFLAQQPEVRDLQAYAGTARPSPSTAWCASTTCAAEAEQGDLQVNLVDKQHRSEKSHVIAQRLRPRWSKSASATAPASRWWKCRPARP
jgi:multidrug efflux pump subunit AcrB